MNQQHGNTTETKAIGTTVLAMFYVHHMRTRPELS